jgi:hypothetical protein
MNERQRFVLTFIVHRSHFILSFAGIRRGGRGIFK